MKEQACIIICPHLALLCALFLFVQHRLFVNLICTGLHQTLPFCRINFCFLFIFQRDQAQHLPGWLTEYESVWHRLPRYTEGFGAFAAVFSFSKGQKSTSSRTGPFAHVTFRLHCQSWGISFTVLLLSTVMICNREACSEVIFREVKFGETGGGEKCCTSRRLKNTCLLRRGIGF